MKTTVWMQALPHEGRDRGTRFDLGAPRPEMVCFDSMATVLARIPRFTGHTSQGVLSVAQHCVEGAKAILRETERWPDVRFRRLLGAAFLLHDGHEAYIGDLATPTVDAIAYFSVIESGDPEVETVVRRAIKALKWHLDEAIYTAAGLPWPLSADIRAVVREFDVRMLRTERDARLAEPPEAWVQVCEDAEPVRSADVSAWTQVNANFQFRQWCRELLPALQGERAAVRHAIAAE